MWLWLCLHVGGISEKRILELLYRNTPKWLGDIFKFTLYHVGMFFLVIMLPKPPPINGNNVAPISWKFTIFYYCIDDFSMTSQMNLLGHEICTDECVCTVTCPGGLQTSNKIRSVWTRCLLRKKSLSLPLRTSVQCTLYTVQVANAPWHAKPG